MQLTIDWSVITHPSRVAKTSDVKRFVLFYRILENLLLQVESKEAGHVSTILAGRKEIQILDTQFRQVAAVLLVRHRPCVLQHHLRSRRTLRATAMAHRFPL